MYLFVSLPTHLQMCMLTHTYTHSCSLSTASTGCFTHACYLSYPWIQFLCWWNWMYSMNAAKHTGDGQVYYNTADEWLHRLFFLPCHYHCNHCYHLNLFWPFQNVQPSNLVPGVKRCKNEANWFRDAAGEEPATLLSKFMHCIYSSLITLTRHIYHIIKQDDYHQKSINQQHVSLRSVINYICVAKEKKRLNTDKNEKEGRSR